MFIDETLETLLVKERKMYPDAFRIVCAEKFKEDNTTTMVRRIENAYQLVVKRHPELNPAAFRRWVWIRSKKVATLCHWTKEFES